jgi:hypothetical protein
MTPIAQTSYFVISGYYVVSLKISGGIYSIVPSFLPAKIEILLLSEI